MILLAKTFLQPIGRTAIKIDQAHWMNGNLSASLTRDTLDRGYNKNLHRKNVSNFLPQISIYLIQMDLSNLNS